MLSVDDVLATRSGKAYDSDGDKVGSVGEVYLDDTTGQPAWVTVNTGLFGTSESFVPLEGARVEGDDLHLPYQKALIKDAPRQDADKHLDVEQEEALYRHYGLATNGSQGNRDAAVAGAAGTAAARGDRDADGHTFDDKARDTFDNEDGRRDGRDNSAFTADRDHNGERDRIEGDVDQARADHQFREADRDLARGDDVRGERHVADGLDDEAGVVRHEERLNVGTERREAGQARLRKYVVTEQQQVEVPVTREEVHVTREPLNERVAGDVQLGEQTESVTLHEERPVVDKETVAVERVGLDVDQVQETQTVQADVAREEVEVDTDGVRGQGFQAGDLDGDGHTLDDKARDFKNNH